MKLVTTIFLFLAATAAGESADQVHDALAGATLRNLEGDEVSLDDLEGRTVVVNFWAEWCAPCRRELPVLDAWSRDFDDVRFVAISIDRDRRKARRLADRLGLELPLFHDGPDGIARELDLPALPITYVVDPKGRTVFTSQGSGADDLESLRIAIASTLPAAATPAEARAER